MNDPPPSQKLKQIGERVRMNRFGLTCFLSFRHSWIDNVLAQEELEQLKFRLKAAMF
jgi:hypothetical protein